MKKGLLFAALFAAVFGLNTAGVFAAPERAVRGQAVRAAATSAVTPGASENVVPSSGVRTRAPTGTSGTNGTKGQGASLGGRASGSTGRSGVPSSSGISSGTGQGAGPKPDSARAAAKKKVVGKKKTSKDDSDKFLSGGNAKNTASFAKGIDDDPCKTSYWGCMDQFCMSENDNGGRCACSQESIALDNEYEKVIGGVEKEIAKTSALETDIETGGDIRAQLSDDDEEDEDGEEEACGESDVSCKVGAAKLTAAAKMCDARVEAACSANHSFVKMQYNQNIRQDCSAYTAAIKNARENGAAVLYAAQKQMRETAAEKFSAENKFNESECIVELRSCMNGSDACGADWSRCVKGGIAEKRIHCENKVLDKCAAVRESVWNAFAADIAPTLKSVEIAKDNDRRQDCLGSVADCIHKACKDDIEGKGVDTMDACLARPEMAQSFCKVELDSCDLNDTMWNFVKAKLAAMRSNACQAEVKTCLEDEGRCGKDYSNCLGLDLPALYDMCPIDKLVVCKQDKQDFSLYDLGNMVMGIFMNIDDKALEQCQKIAEDKMIEVCGSVVNCNQQIDPKIGTMSLRYQNTNGTHYIYGMINWGFVNASGGLERQACISAKRKDCGKYPAAGQLLITNYLDLAAKSPDPDKKNDKNNLDLIESELKSAAGQINNILSLLDDDPKIQKCIGGRDLSQITGSKEKTEARFPGLTNSYRRIIAEAALVQIKDNYNAKMIELIKKAEKSADEIEAEYMCYIKPSTVIGRRVPEKQEVVDLQALNGYSTYKIVAKNSATRQELAELASKKTKVAIDDILTKETTVLYSPATRNCHLCMTDTFHGKRKYVDPRVGETEQMKAELDKIQKEQNETKKAAALLTVATSGLAVAALTGVGIAAAVTAASAAAAVAAAAAAGAALVTAVSSGAAAATIGAAVASTTAALGTVATTGTTAAAVSAAVPVVGWIAAGVIVAGIASFAIWSAFNKEEDPMEKVVTKTVDYCVDEVIGEVSATKPK
ncbi:MAG: hypothetical protein LBB08_00950 [Rickettsiales bacterium]|nr:hypothetical protein [Rickettsiales bacterium]